MDPVNLIKKKEEENDVFPLPNSILACGNQDFS
jgi:hypothetical protein